MAASRNVLKPTRYSLLNIERRFTLRGRAMDPIFGPMVDLLSRDRIPAETVPVSISEFPKPFINTMRYLQRCRPDTRRFSAPRCRRRPYCIDTHRARTCDHPLCCIFSGRIEWHDRTPVTQTTGRYFRMSNRNNPGHGHTRAAKIPISVICWVAPKKSPVMPPARTTNRQAHMNINRTPHNQA